MVSRVNFMPLVRSPQGGLSSLDKSWLRMAITSAATKAGYHGWWLADDLASGISTYLRSDYAGCAINRTQLEKVIRQVLRDVGYEEVAAFFRAKMPCQQISLVQFVDDLPRNDLNEFFDALAECIRSLHSHGIAHLHFTDLRKCMDSLLTTQKIGSEDDSRLTADIVAFVRENVALLFRQRQMWCSIT